jgi:1,4-alpha-glucan branching enzyme
VTLLSADDLHLFNEGRHYRLYERLGAHLVDGAVEFTVWAPNAHTVSVVGDRNGWRPGNDTMASLGSSGLWSARLRGWVPGDRYKFHIEAHNGFRGDKADPLAFAAEQPPGTASVVADLSYAWRDESWMAARASRQSLDAPISIYEVHLGSWRRDENGHSLSYRDAGTRLGEYASTRGFTHVELLPIMAHPFFGSWGYQTTSYFAPTPFYGGPTDFMAFVDALHGQGVGVVLDWVPSHFPSDEFALANFDGTQLYEHADPKQGLHPDWQTLVFNYDRHEVRSFLISSACFWLDRYHVDGLRVDAVASMLYLDYSRQPDEWVPNEHGGRENLGAIAFLRELNEEVYRSYPDVQTYAEESTAWPGVSRPTSLGGLGFGTKWDMGWMHDTLQYFERDPIHRRYHHDELTFRGVYAWTENYVLPLSHDEVVYGKRSLASKMPGDEWQQLSNLRLLLGYQWASPGKKLLFMGGELAQWGEWDHDGQCDWWLLDNPPHAGVAQWVTDLNAALRRNAALHERDNDPGGFGWAVADDRDRSILAFLRYASDGTPILFIGNFTPNVWHNVRMPVPRGGTWCELLNSDAEVYGGSGAGNMGGVQAHPAPMHEHAWSLTLTVPPLGALFLTPETR